MNTLSLGAKIKSLRKRKGLTQKELAEAIPTSFSTFRRWENDIHTPNLKELSRLAEILDVSANEFIEDNDTSEHIKSKENIQSNNETNHAQFTSISYWGEVLDNMRKLAQSKNINEISLIYPLVKSGCEMLAQVKNSTISDDINISHVDIRQNNFGRDATVNFGTTSASYNSNSNNNLGVINN